MNRTSNGRFIDHRVKIDKDLLKKSLLEIKKFNNFTWQNLADQFNLCEYSIRHDWIKKGNTIPLSVFKSLIKIHPTLRFDDFKNQIRILKPFWGQKNGNKSSLEDKIIFPDVKSKDFAEFYGIMLGDGCVYADMSGFCISSDSLVDQQYNKEYISKLIFKLFGIKPKIYYSKTDRSMKCVIYSKKITNFIVNLGFPRGKKIYGNPKILNIFFKDKLLLASCIRGLCDTDGSICRHPHTGIMLNVSIYSKSLLQSSIKAFNKLGIPIGYYDKGLNMYGKDKLHEYFKRIGSSNTKHIIKYKSFINHGIVLTKLEVENLLKRKNEVPMKLPYMGS